MGRWLCRTDGLRVREGWEISFGGGLRISENIGCELWVLCRF